MNETRAPFLAAIFYNGNSENGWGGNKNFIKMASYSSIFIICSKGNEKEEYKSKSRLFDKNFCQ